MGMMTMVKARNAAAKFGKGDIEGAMQLYKEAMDEGLFAQLFHFADPCGQV
ncbi:MAG: hypothetical protein RSH26_01495 [Clostridia bacterium]